MSSAKQRRFIAACSLPIILSGPREGPLVALEHYEDRLFYRLMALDITGVWEAGDDIRVIEALLIPFGSYTLDCTQKCMNQLEDMSTEAALRVKALLDEYDAADDADSNQNTGDVEGKVLVKADVLEWEVVGGHTGLTGPQKEKNKIRYELWQYFAFCSCLGSLNPNGPGGGGSYGGYGSGQLIRS